MPATSTTARTGPPAMTPVPSEAGFRRTRPAPNSPTTWYGMVLLMEGDRDHGLLGLLHRFADGFGHFVSLAQTRAYLALAVADHHNGAESEAAPALDDLGDAVDADHLIG